MLGRSILVFGLFMCHLDDATSGVVDAELYREAKSNPSRFYKTFVEFEPVGKVRTTLGVDITRLAGPIRLKLRDLKARGDVSDFGPVIPYSKEDAGVMTVTANGKAILQLGQSKFPGVKITRVFADDKIATIAKPSAASNDEAKVAGPTERLTPRSIIAIEKQSKVFLIGDGTSSSQFVAPFFPTGIRLPGDFKLQPLPRSEQGKSSERPGDATVPSENSTTTPKSAVPAAPVRQPEKPEKTAPRANKNFKLNIPAQFRINFKIGDSTVKKEPAESQPPASKNVEQPAPSSDE